MQRPKGIKEVIGFNDHWMLIIGIPIASVIVSMLLFTDYYTQANFKALVFCIPISLVYTTVFWLTMRKTYHLVKLKFPTPEDIIMRVFLAFGTFMLCYFLVDGSLDAFFCHVFPERRDAPVPLVEFVVTLVLSALVIAIYEAASFYLQLALATKEKAELERHYVASQLEGLRNQVNPHFLFNSMNTLIYLIPESPDKAVNFVQKMSKVYRYVLESRESKLIALESELEFLRSYVYLLKERFGDNLHVDMERLPSRPGVAIVPLSLQMLFENAIKHNVISTEKPLTIELFVENNRLIVRNNLQKKNQVMDSTGVGLQNIKDRYRMLCDQEVEVIVSLQYFTVALPLMEIEAPVE